MAGNSAHQLSEEDKTTLQGEGERGRERERQREEENNNRE
jgi:hypothetical protein